MNNTLITFNQTLHGYINGHSLIASSIELPIDVKRVMLELSDMSGMGMETEFKEYITGYPLKETNMYAIAKTWYANEMKRPGCVWTHTILIDFADLAKLGNLNKLLSLFKRPNEYGIENNIYWGKIILSEEITYTDIFLISEVSLKAQLSQVIKNLYHDDDKSVIINSQSLINLDLLLLMIWRQQWPRLKRNFTFCSGGNSIRNYKGKSLDLQVINSYSDKSKIKNENLTIVEFNTVNIDNSYNISNSWIEEAVNDLFNPSEIIQSFLNYFGADVTIKKTSFKFLFETYLYYNKQKPTLLDSIEFLAKRFPDSKEANILKASILNGVNKYFDFLPRYDEISVLSCLTITEYFSCFDFEKLNYQERFAQAFKHPNPKNIGILKQIIDIGPNKYGEEAISNLAKILIEQDDLNSIWVDRQLSSVFINLNPKLALSRLFWMANLNRYLEIVNQLERTNLSKEEWCEIIDILLEIDPTIDLRTFDKLQLNLAFRILNLINDGKLLRIENTWINYLKKKTNEVLEWMSLYESTEIKVVEIIVKILDPNSAFILNYGISPWMKIVNSFDEERWRLLNIEIHTFFLALSFNFNSTEFQKILGPSLDILYAELSKDTLDYKLWRNIEIYTKPLAFWKDWDKCKKIVNAIVDFYLDKHIPIKPLLLQVRDSELQDRLKSVYKKRK